MASTLATAKGAPPARLIADSLGKRAVFNSRSSSFIACSSNPGDAIPRWGVPKKAYTNIETNGRGKAGRGPDQALVEGHPPARHVDQPLRPCGHEEVAP